ncbi:hypothetical protein [Chitinophaga vietnamensis]|uniref:hypothetical protein n=1 Tax=Chitinophaga vietnamensis TaxID=2593957 RepID=UPI0011789918|nr:hypothetical protein [Chitinophaga vietnamensis]
MTNQNRISVVVPPEVLQQTQTKFEEIAQLLKPYLQVLTKEDRQSMLKMGDGTIPFVQKALDYARNKPQFAPPYLDIPEMERDVAAANVFTSMHRASDQLNSKLDDTIMLAGSEAFQAALGYYNSVKQAARMNVPDAKLIYEDLRQRFPGRPKGSSNGE